MQINENADNTPSVSGFTQLLMQNVNINVCVNNSACVLIYSAGVLKATLCNSTS